ncbi:MAG: hypothetical protein WD138_04905, partial [Halofilum sp. (in: g-proteobacteria)]
MDHFDYRDGRLYAERMALSELAARFGTPQYVYSRAALEQQWHAFDGALGARPHRVCYAVKANSNLAVLDTLARLGSGFDIVSVGELERCLAVGADPAGIVYSGVAKRAEEMGRALEVGIGCFNVESAAELERLAAVAAARGAVAPVALRVNPEVDPATVPGVEAVAAALSETTTSVRGEVGRQGSTSLLAIDPAAYEAVLAGSPTTVRLPAPLHAAQSLPGSG